METKNLRCTECGSKHLTDTPETDYPERSFYPVLNTGEVYCMNCERTIRIARVRAQENARQKRNATARMRYSLLRDLGMTKTPYGWE